MIERTRIMTQIVGLCTTPRAKTEIMYETNLNHAQLKVYLDFLLSEALLEHNLGEYVATKKGQSFIEAITQLSCALQDYTRSVSHEMERALGKKERV